MRRRLILWTISSGPNATIKVVLNRSELPRGECRRALGISVGGKPVRLNKGQSMLSSGIDIHVPRISPLH